MSFSKRGIVKCGTRKTDRLLHQVLSLGNAPQPLCHVSYMIVLATDPTDKSRYIINHLIALMPLDFSD